MSHPGAQHGEGVARRDVCHLGATAVIVRQAYSVAAPSTACAWPSGSPRGTGLESSHSLIHKSGAGSESLQNVF